MKITIEIPDKILQAIANTIAEYSDVKVTVDELKANPKLEAFIQSDLDTMYFQYFTDGLASVDLVEELDLG